MMKKIVYLTAIWSWFSFALYGQQPTTSNNDAAVNYPVFLNISENLGTVTVFQSKDDPNNWYTLPNRVRLMNTPEGRPMFGFQKFVKNVRSGADEKEKESGVGGGVVWFTVGFEYSPEERQAIEQELRRRKGAPAKLVGAIAYESGTIELVTFGREKTGEEKTEVLGIGSAPLMDGDAIAVNIVLNAENATKLWETFRLDNPNIGMNFNMQVRGYHTPVGVIIKMDSKKIYNNERMAAGINASMSGENTNVVLGAEIESLTQDLMNEGSISIQQTGDIGADFEEIKKMVVEEFARAFFQPVSMQDIMQMSQSLRGGQSPLERAAGLRGPQINNNRQNNDTSENDDYLDQGPEETTSQSAPSTTLDDPFASPPPPRRRNAGNAPTTSTPSQPGSGSTEAAPASNGSATPPPPDPITSGSSTTVATTPPNDPDASVPPAPEPDDNESLVMPPSDSQAAPESASPSATSGSNPTTNSGNNSNNNNPTRNSQPAGNRGGGSNMAIGVNLYAGYQVSRIRQTLNMSVNLAKIRAVQRSRTITTQFPRIPRSCFQEINLDDPLYKQRELVAMIDGFNARDFGSFINYATVNMRKRHVGGEISTDEVRIDRNNFSREGNHFKLLYGWRSGENDRRNWLNYEYQVAWSFFGGGTLASEWTPATQQAISITPPVQKYTVRLSGDREALRGRQVRAVTVKIFYSVGGVRTSRLRSINLSREEITGDMDVLLPASLEYEYEIVWQLNGNRTQSSGVLRASTLDLFVDELP